MGTDYAALAEAQARAAAHARKIWYIQLAAKSGDKWSSDHPDNIRAEIARMRGLLKEAGV